MVPTELVTRRMEEDRSEERKRNLFLECERKQEKTKTEEFEPCYGACKTQDMKGMPPVGIWDMPGGSLSRTGKEVKQEKKMPWDGYKYKGVIGGSPLWVMPPLQALSFWWQSRGQQDGKAGDDFKRRGGLKDLDEFWSSQRETFRLIW